MTMKRSIGISALFLLLFFSCRERQGAMDAAYLIVPPTANLPENTRFSDLLEEYRYIVPETTEESLFAYISKAYIDRGSLYIFDRWNVDKILVFDVGTGKFLRAIGSQGRGPGEYADLQGFTLDRVRRELLLVDRSGQKVLVYDADSGAFKRSFEVDFYPQNIEYVDENTLAYEAGSRDPRLFLTDREGRVLGSYIPYNDKNEALQINSFSRGTGDEILFRTDLCDSLFTVTPQGPVFSRFVDFGADALTWDAYKTFPRSELTGLIDRRGARNYRTNIRYYSETDSHIRFLYFDKGTPAIVVYDKKAGAATGYSTAVVNDIVFDKMPLLIVAADENWFIGTNDAYSIVENIEQTGRTDIPEDLKALSANDNPVITLVKFK
jgi:hypothetical protein